MARVILSFSDVGGRSGAVHVSAPVLNTVRSEILTSGAASVQSQFSAPAPIAYSYVENGNTYSYNTDSENREGGFVTVTVTGGNVWIDSGLNPTAKVPAAGATDGRGFPVLDGQSITFAVSRGHKIAVINLT